MFKNKTQKYEIERQPFAHYVKKEIVRGVRVKLPVFKALIIRRFKSNPHSAAEFYERKGLDSNSLYALYFATFAYEEKRQEAEKKIEEMKKEHEKEIHSLMEKKTSIEKRIENMHKVNSSAKDEGMSYDIYLLESLTKRLGMVIKEKKEAFEETLKQKAEEFQKAALAESVERLKKLLEHARKINKV
ncbi:MAG: hypothetical protein QXN37_01970 [Candidatus Anstonellaceae archaeon]